MHDQYFAIRLIRRFGSRGAGVIAVVITIAAFALLWPPTGWLALPIAAAIGTLTFILARSYVELVSLVFEKLN